MYSMIGFSKSMSRCGFVFDFIVMCCFLVGCFVTVHISILRFIALFVSSSVNSVSKSYCEVRMKSFGLMWMVPPFVSAQNEYLSVQFFKDEFKGSKSSLVTSSMITTSCPS